MRAASDEPASELLREAASSYSCTRSVADRFPRVAAAGAALPSAAASANSIQRNRAELFGATPAMVIVSAGRFAVAETGSVALDEPPVDRGACFLAERLWLLVPMSDIVDGLDDAIQRVRELVNSGAHHPLLMTGPSRTADIERTLTVGVHGPRSLVIIVVGNA
ncbi:MAG: LUD domain-containing protein [Chloroflexi bacterium]|nr:LUD domain-containing protein [Chloroflexota bacterium]